MSRISVVVNTLNEERNIRRCLQSVNDWVDEIVVVDMRSEDKTVKIASEFTDKIYFHKRMGYVEPARNFAISKARGDYILILDADEEIPKSLALKLRSLAQLSQIDWLKIPRKNIIFGKWIKQRGWWPDYNLRFFKKGKVVWKDKIHSVPKAEGRGMELDLRENNAIIHYHYTSIGQYVDRLNRYTDVQSRELLDSGYKFELTDLFIKPWGEFLSRFFDRKGYKDGLHGLALSLLQAFSFLIVYLKVWEAQGFKSLQSVTIKKEFVVQVNRFSKELRYWLELRGFVARSLIARVFRKFKFLKPRGKS